MGRLLAKVLLVAITLVPSKSPQAVPQSTTPQPMWETFSLGPATSGGLANSKPAVRKGIMRAKSISAKSLIGFVAGISPTRVLGPEWIDTERYSVTAILSDNSRGRLRRRSPTGASSDEEFRLLFTQEIVSRFQLKMHTEQRSQHAFVASLLSGQRLKVHESKALEGGHLKHHGSSVTNMYSVIDARGLTFLELCNWLERQLNAPVIPNPTFPPGVWDFRVKWRTADQNSLLAAIRDQIGIDLVEGNAAINYLVVDHIEKPSVLP